MRKRMIWPALLIAHLLLGPSQHAALAAPSEADQRLVAAVAARIFAEAAPVVGWAWPPLVAISDKEEVNAFATVGQVKAGETPVLTDEGTLVWVAVPAFTPAAGDAGSTRCELEANPDGTVTQPIIVLSQGLLEKVVKGNPDRLAAVLGHEVAHILLRHVDGVAPGAPLAANVITQQQEAAADVLGMKLGLAADFPYRGLVGGLLAMRDQGNGESFEGMNDSHPGWTDRLAMIDERQSELWPSISAFENGVCFLMAEQYALAESCFRQVVKECPKCHEAWANLGYACLMQYCDALEPEDLRDLDVGQLVVGGFYRRPESLEGPTRGVGAPDVVKHWWDAVGALRQALILNPELVLPRANLAVAYLVGPPDGRDVGQAAQLFAEVTAALESGAAEEMDPLVRASLLVNAGVAQMAAGDAASAERFFAQAESLFAARAAGGVVASSIHYNRGRMYAAAADATQRRAAIEEFEAYLASSSPAANWWPLAYEQYAKFCDEQGVEPKAKNALSLAANTQHLLVAGITLADGMMVTLNDSPEALEDSLGAGRVQDVVRQSNVRRLQYADLGIEVLCAEHIVAIRLRGPEAPAVAIRTGGPGGETHELRPGMTIAELDAVMGGDAAAWDQRCGADAQVVYRFYTRLGLGVRIAEGRIVEILVARVPVEAKGKGRAKPQAADGPRQAAALLGQAAEGRICCFAGRGGYTERPLLPLSFP